MSRLPSRLPKLKSLETAAALGFNVVEAKGIELLSLYIVQKFNNICSEKHLHLFAIVVIMFSRPKQNVTEKGGKSMSKIYFVKLNDLLKQKRYSQRAIAQEIGVSVGTFNSRMQKKTSWLLSEVCKIQEILGISDADLRSYFQ